MRVSAILFDKDGTLVDFQRTWGPATLRLIDHFAPDNGTHRAALHAIAEIDPATGAFAVTSPIIAGSTADYGPALAAALGRQRERAFFTEVDEVYRAFARESLAAVPGALAAVRRAAGLGLPLGLATNDAEANAREQLDQLGFAPFFTFVAGYDSGFGVKPDPGMVLAFAARLGLAPGRIALIGDSRHDLTMARAAGAVAVAVTSGPATAQDLAPHADIVVPDLMSAIAALGLEPDPGCAVAATG